MTKKEHSEVLQACLAAVAFDPRVEPGNYLHDEIEGWFRISAVDCLAICHVTGQVLPLVENGAEMVEFRIELNAGNQSATITVYPDLKRWTETVVLSPDEFVQTLKRLIVTFLNERDAYCIQPVPVPDDEPVVFVEPEPMRFKDERGKLVALSEWKSDTSN